LAGGAGDRDNIGVGRGGGIIRKLDDKKKLKVAAARRHREMKA
jgi:hypothetical protein